MQLHPFLDTSFKVRWSRLTPEHVEADIQKALDDAQANIDALAAPTDEVLTFENTPLAMDEATEALNVAWGKVNHLNSVRDSKELREAYNKMLPTVSEFFAKIPLNEGLWKRLSAYAETDEAKALTGIRKRFLDDAMAGFIRSGADLPADQKKRFEEIEAQLAKITQKYSENVLDATNAWELIIDDEARLAGLPELAREQAQQNAEKKGHGDAENPKWRFTLQAPSLIPILKYAEDDDLRKTVWTAFSEIGRKEPHSNLDSVWEILKLRDEKAKMLGYQSFADYSTERRMAKSGAKALSFEEDMHDRILSIFEKETKELEAFRAEKLGVEPELMEPWDVAFWAEKYRKEKFDFDSEQLRPYFSADRVLEGMFEITQKIFGVTIREAKATFSEDPSTEDSDAYETWDESVKVFEMLDESGDHIGSFYTDWFPRESKRSGAWMNYSLTGDRSEGKKEPHLGMIHGNMTPPTATKPALLSHDDVTTIFHEFGHLIHHLFGDVEIKSMNGVNVAWDFVELPSQIMENWCWDRKALDLFARHYETGEAIPEDLYQKLVNTRSFNAATFAMRQLSFGKMDLEMHHHFANFSEDKLEDQLKVLLETYAAKRKTEPKLNLYSFGHLFSDPMGYAAGYYSYKWAEVLDADAFTRFEKEGILNPDTGREFKAKLLSKGNSEDPMKLFVDFMGREPDAEALLRREGLA